MKTANRSSVRPRGGRGKRENYQTVLIRVPLPLQQAVAELIDRFHAENAFYESLPLSGHWSEVLGVSPTASEDEVKDAWRKIAKRYHPDKAGNNARQRFEAARAAYEAWRSQNSK